MQNLVVNGNCDMIACESLPELVRPSPETLSGYHPWNFRHAETDFASPHYGSHLNTWPGGHQLKLLFFFVESNPEKSYSPFINTFATSIMGLPEGYTLRAGFPPVADYRHIRVASGLSPKTEAQAQGAVTGSWYGCFVEYQDSSLTSSESQIVGMGRIIGDGGWYFHIADMGVVPEHQKKGLGDVILKHLLAHIKATAAEGEPYITLFADPPGRKLYAKNDFVDAAIHDELGMVLESKKNHV